MNQIVHLCHLLANNCYVKLGEYIYIYIHFFFFFHSMWVLGFHIRIYNCLKLVVRLIVMVIHIGTLQVHSDSLLIV